MIKRILTCFIPLIIMIFLFGCTQIPKSDSATPGPTTVNPDGYPIQKNGSEYPAPDTVPSDVTSILYPTTTPNPRAIPIIIEAVVKDGSFEVIKIKNISNETQNLKMFYLVDPQTNQIKSFEHDLLLESQDVFEVFNGPWTVEDAGDGYWLKEPILKQTGDEILLLNEAARIIWTYIFYPEQ